MMMMMMMGSRNVPVVFLLLLLLPMAAAASYSASSSSDYYSPRALDFVQRERRIPNTNAPRNRRKRRAYRWTDFEETEDDYDGAYDDEDEDNHDDVDEEEEDFQSLYFMEENEEEERLLSALDRIDALENNGEEETEAEVHNKNKPRKRKTKTSKHPRKVYYQPQQQRRRQLAATPKAIPPRSHDNERSPSRSDLQVNKANKERAVHNSSPASPKATATSNNNNNNNVVVPATPVSTAAHQPQITTPAKKEGEEEERPRAAGSFQRRPAFDYESYKRKHRTPAAPTTTAAQQTSSTTPTAATTAPQHETAASAILAGTTPWVAKFVSERPKDALLKIPREFLADGFNLVHLPPIIERIGGSHDPSFPVYKAALRLILDLGEVPPNINPAIQRAAEALYVLVHARYIVSPRGLDTVRRVLLQNHNTFGQCPHPSCQGMPLLPYGRSNEPTGHNAQRYCCSCGNLWEWWDSKVDGCAWGPSFCHLFLLTYGKGDLGGVRGMMGMPEKRAVTPTVFGFRVHTAALRRLHEP